MIKAYPNLILNIHPALLPKYGGKGMYGMNVHKAVVENNEENRVLQFIMSMKITMRVPLYFRQHAIW